MADLNALIAQGAQFKAPPDPFEQYGRMQQLTQGQQTNQLNMMQMQEYQRKAESLNKLRSTPAPEGVNPDYWAADPEKALTLRTADVEGKTKSVKLLADKLALLPEAYRMADTPEAYLTLHQSVHSDPVIGPWLKSIGATPEQGMATFQEAVQTGKFNDLRMKSMQSVSQLLESMKPQVVGAGSSVYSPQTGTFTTAPERTDTDLIRNFNAAKAQGFTGNLLEYQKQIAQAGRAPRAEAAPRTQQVTLSDGSLGIVNMDTGVITPSTVGNKAVKGKLSAGAEKTAGQQKELGKNIDQAIFELGKAIEPKGLIDQSTGSGIGRAYDVSAGFFGQAPEGAIAAGKLAPIADLVLKMVPRFEGPQSDKDTQSYKEAAGQLSNSSLPREIRKAAAKEILRLFKNRKNQFGANDMASEGAAPSTPAVAPPAGFTPD
jgi:hypothetical protein